MKETDLLSLKIKLKNTDEQRLNKLKTEKEIIDSLKEILIKVEKVGFPIQIPSRNLEDLKDITERIIRHEKMPVKIKCEICGHDKESFFYEQQIICKDCLSEKTKIKLEYIN